MILLFKPKWVHSGKETAIRMLFQKGTQTLVTECGEMLLNTCNASQLLCFPILFKGTRLPTFAEVLNQGIKGSIS